MKDWEISEIGKVREMGKMGFCKAIGLLWVVGQEIMGAWGGWVAPLELPQERDSLHLQSQKKPRVDGILEWNRLAWKRVGMGQLYIRVVI